MSDWNEALDAAIKVMCKTDRIYSVAALRDIEALKRPSVSGGGENSEPHPFMCIVAPFSTEQVIALNRFQQYGFVHEFTCPTLHEEGRALVATKRGWICPHCDYTQNWAHPEMLQEFENPLTALKPPVGE